MKKSCLFLGILSFFVLSMVVPVYSWQGRMAGMGDPYGLVEDESDFLIFPAKIAQGQGLKFYGDYRFTYTDVTDWNYNLDQLNTAGTLTGFSNYDTSGHEYKHNALLGAGFPLGPGRMGLFFTYDGMRGNYDGNEAILGTSNYAKYHLTKDLDNFALRLLYGLPSGSFKLGGEFQLAYRQEESRNSMPGYLNYTLGTQIPNRNLTPFQLPYDSSYWEALFKGSLERKVGPLDLEFALRGGFIFGGNNNFRLTQTTIVIDDDSGDVDGWRIGGDLWTRYPLATDLTLPFLIRVDYQEKSRDGVGLRPGSGYNYPYDTHEKNLQLETGGGVDKIFGKGTRIAAGIYYNYLHGEYDFRLKEVFGGTVGQVWNHKNYPDSTEHQVMLRLAGEHEFSPTAALRMGLNFFYGWVREDFKFSYGSSYTDDITPDGSHWGIGASLGGTIKILPITLEPFINGGWQKLSLNGDGERTLSTGAINNLWEMDKLRKEWSIGGGFSIKF